MKKADSRSPWAWIPTLYLAEGLPNVLVTTVAVIMYKRLGISNTDIALYTGLLYLPWVIKPFWSPVVDIVRTKRFWIVAMQLLLAVTLAGVAFSIPAGGFFRYSLAFLWLMAFSSATHDIAADGFYMLGLSQHQQAFFVGIRNTFYRFAVLAAQGPLVILAGHLETSTQNNALAWSVVFAITAALFGLFMLYHLFFLPHPPADAQTGNKGADNLLTNFGEVFVSFFKKKGIAAGIAFLLLFRLGESQLGKMASPFLLDSRDRGGLGLGTAEIGYLYGTAGIVALTLGGILGGIAVSRHGLKRWLWPMIVALNFPDIAYVVLAWTQSQNIWVIASGIVWEQIGYGFGFTAYLLYMIQLADGEHKTAHYALCTGFMALGMMLPGMISGWIEDQLGYRWFFVWVMVCTLPGFFLAPFLTFDPDFGKKETT